MKTILFVLLAVVLLGACGGGKKQAETTPDPGGGDEIAKPEGDDGAMVPPETMDEIQRRFDRRRTAVSRCLSMAVDAKELPKTSHGKITLGVTVSRGGKPEDIKIIRASLESKTLEECVVARVKEIEFPEVPTPFPTTYTYAFEAL